MKKTLRLSLSALLLAIAIGVTQIPALPLIAEESVSKDSDFELKGTILVSYTGTAKTVSVPASVTEIGAEAFAGNTTMEKLEFKGSAVEKVDYRAFAGCSGLKEVKLPNSVLRLGNGAFADCTALEKFTIGSGLSDPGIGTFAGCIALKTITVDKNNTAFSVDDGCLYNADKSKLYLLLPVRKSDSYTMPSSVTDIAEYAFWGNEAVTTVRLSSNLKKIPDYAFANCKSLTGISIPYSVTVIGLKSFADCVNLENVSIPSSVLIIHDTAFDGCKKLNIIAQENTPAYDFFEEWKKRNPSKNEDVTTDNTNSFPFGDLLGSVSGGDSQGNISQGNTSQGNTSQGNTSQGSNHGTGNTTVESGPMGNILGSTYIVGNSAVVLVDSALLNAQGTAAVPNAGQSDGSSGNTEGNTGTIPDGSVGGTDGIVEEIKPEGSTEKGYDIPKMIVAGNTVLADLAYYQSSGMADYQFPNGIEEIGEFAFARSNITKANIPNGVKEIAYGAFYHCDYLSEVRIPSSVTYIAPKAFDKSMWLETWLNASGDDYLIVGDGILLAYRGDGGNLTLPDTVKVIAPEAFANNHSIVSVYLPDSVTDIGEDAFAGCINLEKVTGGANVKTIRDRAFAGCELSSAHVFANVTQLGLRSFDFSQTSYGDSQKVVVFDSTDALPVAGHELTAERLSNTQARGNILGDTKIVVVDKKIRAEQLANLALFTDGSGFKGLIVYISSRDQAQVTCLATTYTKEELASVYLPDYVSIDGKSYEILGKENPVILGNSQTYTPGSIEVVNTGSALTGNISATLGGNTGAYRLDITDDENGAEAIKAGYEAVYREELPSNAVFAEMNLIDCNTGVPITKMGMQSLQVTVTLPASVSGGSLRIFTVDRNGQLESLSYTLSGNNVTFSTNHLSPIAFCRVSNTVSGRLDASPDTGDKQINPNYILAAGLVGLAVAILFIKKKR
ncbi:MAG: leucine-rich repeat domain-containing protein [Lachnospiraceae bacterium]|nr:leucine-rich repeat domain-containing protein [Lachnospiraceae bacterium]